MPHQRGVKPVAQNKKAYHDYFVEETYECGLCLKGTEVKSMRQGRVNLKESFALVRGNEVFAEGMHISPYEQGSFYLKDGRMQLELGLCRGKHLHDKRDAAAARDAKREIERALRQRD